MVARMQLQQLRSMRAQGLRPRASQHRRYAVAPMCVAAAAMPTTKSVSGTMAALKAQGK